jgi:hypothetical protein
MSRDSDEANAAQCAPREHAVHRSLGRQSVTRDRDMKAMGEGSFGGEAEALLGVALPIAAMKKQQRRGAGAVRGEEIEAGAGRIAIDEVGMRVRSASLRRSQSARYRSLSATAAELL